LAVKLGCPLECFNPALPAEEKRQDSGETQDRSGDMRDRPIAGRHLGANMILSVSTCAIAECTPRKRVYEIKKGSQVCGDLSGVTRMVGTEHPHIEKTSENQKHPASGFLDIWSKRGGGRGRKANRLEGGRPHFTFTSVEKNKEGTGRPRPAHRKL